ncbi:3-hydroxyacyl-CoA dehydrogenase NAD-binding domain-containing protein [Shimia sp.]|uniref:3-hydroxyacyl-CoA dehydrogenase NAD-binding domain-containing protein n=1 Tax=Shimia sp. TaxID=1954381 RepID=UPI003297A964
MADRQVVSIEVVGEVALICIDNPPVNAGGIAVRRGLAEAVERFGGQDGIKAIGLYCAGRTFVAGADISEFGKPPQAPMMPELYDIVEACAVPLVCALHGTALGGGLELAMACHARVAVASARVGLPEIHLGLLPGAGGTQRAPRLIGIASALDLSLSGRQVAAPEALDMGLIDRIDTGAPRDMALQAAQDVVAGILKTRRTRDLQTAPDDDAIATALAQVRKKSPLLVSPVRCIEAIAAATGPFEAGMKVERAAFLECLATDQSKGMIHAFFGERAVGNIPEKTAMARDIAQVGVIGGGTMGSGIATSALMSGLSVTLVEVTQEALARGVSTITSNLEGAVNRGKMTAAARDAAVARLNPVTGLEGLAEADLVIEAVFEDMAVKKEIFGKLDTFCKPGAILASNTSYLDINEIAASTRRPADVLGLHFFSPAHIMRLLEVVVGAQTAPEVVATGFALARQMKKVAVRAGVCDGFIGNRILAHYSKVAAYLVLDGASPTQVDTALETFGFAMGPHKVGDLAGLDIGWMTRKRKAATRSPDERYGGDVADRICENGWFGCKTGQGYYVYDTGSIEPNPEVSKIIEAVRVEKGIQIRAFDDQEIVERYMTAMICEAVRVLEDGIARRPVDIDVVFLMGYGFPRFRGGPLHYADTIGAAELVKRVETYAAEDAHFWQVPAMLRRMADTGGRFGDLNKRG